MSANALYTDLSGYYDLMCVDIDYHAQSHGVSRLAQLFGNGGKRHLDLACGTGPHVRHFLDFGFQSAGLDINQPMLDIAAKRCPEAQFSMQDMGNFSADEPLDLITCFLYSIHYNGGIDKLKQCIASVHNALADDGLFCFNAVAKDKINNALFVEHGATQDAEQFTFRSSWYYCGDGEMQALKLSITKSNQTEQQIWQDEHPMVAVSFAELVALLSPYFEVQLFEHDYHKILPMDAQAGNAIVVCTKKPLVN
ncbi:class I SAM-dependent methyltransferase [Shewanella sp. A3A]|nr:class I SAM-dependent methyltransferase [Shewanella ferrihydritica]